MTDGYVKIKSYAADNQLSVLATGNTLTANGTADNINCIDAKTVEAQDDFLTPVAKIGGEAYYSFADALAAAAKTDALTVIELVAGELELGSVKFPATLKNVIIKGADGKQTIIKNSLFYSADGNSAVYEGITFDGIVFDQSQIVFTGNRNGEVIYKDIAITNCEFKNIVSTSNAAVHFNLASDETIENFTFTNNVINGVTGGSVSGLRLNYVSGNIVIKDNVITGAAWNAIQMIHVNADSIVIEGNTLASGADEGILNLYNVTTGTITVKNNKFMVQEGQPGIAYLASADVSENYWGGNAPANLPAGVTFANYYADEAMTDLVIVVAKIGGVYYTSLEAAFKAATDGCVIEILADVTIDYKWDARYTGAKFTVPVTINGNGHTLKFTGVVNDGYNHYAAFRFEADATVTNLTIDMSEAVSEFQGRFRAISAKANLTVDGCTFIGNGSAANTRAIIFGEGAGENVGNLVISITNSEFIGWRRAITDNENAKDVKSVTITGNTIEDASVYVSAAESVIFTGNTVEGGYVNIKSYAADNQLSVTATGNTLTANGTDNNINYIEANTVVAQDDFLTPVAKIGGTCYVSLADAIAEATNGQTITLVADVEYDGILMLRGITLDLNGYTLETEGLVAFKNANVLDNGATKGLLKVADKDLFTLSGGAYPMLPVWNEEETGYIFVNVNPQSMLEVKAEDKFTVIYRPSINGGGVTDEAIFGDGAADNDLIFKINILCMEDGVVAETLGFTISNELIRKIYTENRAIQLSIRGATDIFEEYKIEFVIESASGVAFTSIMSNSFVPVTVSE